MYQALTIVAEEHAKFSEPETIVGMVAVAAFFAALYLLSRAFKRKK